MLSTRKAPAELVFLYSYYMTSTRKREQRDSVFAKCAKVPRQRYVCLRRRGSPGNFLMRLGGDCCKLAICSMVETSLLLSKRLIHFSCLMKTTVITKHIMWRLIQGSLILSFPSMQSIIFKEQLSSVTY